MQLVRTFLKKAMGEREASDFFPPVLIKEVRQGMRTRTFVGVFLVMQVLMIFTVIMSLIGANADDFGGNAMTGMSSVLFWVMVSIPLALVMPIRGMNAVGAEVRAGTLELLYLTRLSAWRIVFGKWFSLFSQTVLLLIAVLPYVMLRYFLGGINTVDELRAIAWLLLFSGMFTALTVGFSAFPGVLLKILLSVGFFIALWMVPSLLMARSFTGYTASVSTGPEWMYMLLSLAVAVTLGFLFLEFGAAQIAPPAENHAFRKRLAAAVLLLLGWVCSLEPMLRGISVVCIIGIAAVMLNCLLEPARLIPSLYARNARGPTLFRPARRFFYPGWPFSLIFTLAMAGGIGVILSEMDAFSSARTAAAFVTLFGSLVWTVTLIHVLLPATRRPLTWFIGIQAGCILVAVIAAAIHGAADLEVAYWLIPVPPALFWQIVFDTMSNDAELTLTIASGLLSLACLLILSIRSFKVKGSVREMEREIRERGHSERRGTIEPAVLV